MREIKFRVPIECNACKFKGFQYFEWNGQSFTPSGYDKCECEKLEIIGEPQQFTGLKDKNGKEIYEGDILGGIFKSCYISWCDKCKSFQVINCLQECMACEGDFHWFEIISDKDIEVIGNIFENPELINHPLT